MIKSNKWLNKFNYAFYRILFFGQDVAGSTDQNVVGNSKRQNYDSQVTSSVCHSGQFGHTINREILKHLLFYN